MTAPAGDPVARLLDLEAIKQLKARYFRSVDSKQYADFRAVFTDDATIKGTFASGSDIDRFVADVADRHAGAVTVHRGADPEITFVDGDTATGVWAMFDLLEWQEGGGPAEYPGFRGFRGFGYYHETYRRVDGKWKIAELELTRTRIDPF